MITSFSTNRLQNIFSRYQDNTQKTGVLFQNDSHEQETKIRFQTQHYLEQWKLLPEPTFNILIMVTLLEVFSIILIITQGSIL